MLTLTWTEYAEWLVATNGMDIQDALVKAGRLYEKQYKKSLDNEHIKHFLDDRVKPREL